MQTTLRRNWFWPVAIVLLAIVWAFSNTLAVSLTAEFELALLFDVFVTLPLLFIICYRGTLTNTALLARVIALQCSGVWLASKLIPADAQTILPQLEWVRWAGLAIIILFEIRLVVAMVGLIWKPPAKQQDLEAIGMPPLVAKLALLEARFWRWVLRRPNP